MTRDILIGSGGIRGAATTLLLILGLSSACGAGKPGNHILADDLPGQIPTNQYVDAPFDVPTSAQISYQIADRSSTTPDKFKVAIVPDSEIGYFQNNQPFHSYGDQNGTAPLSGQASVPTGSYHLVILCNNIIEDCQFSYTLDAFF
jgi:hypothetical protein